MERRLMLKLVAAGVLAPRVNAGPQHLVSIAPQAAYTLEFFSTAQNEMLDRLSDWPGWRPTGGACGAGIPACRVGIRADIVQHSCLPCRHSCRHSQITRLRP
jgi:hypothetical protein